MVEADWPQSAPAAVAWPRATSQGCLRPTDRGTMMGVVHDLQSGYFWFAR